ncbi:MAG: hypothetical protein II743_00795 [Lachnospiraceae bacterium]|nr:hypothetical protein [Lachnospiraceae bacterium]
MKNVIRASLYKMFHDKALRICLVGTAIWALLVSVMLTWAADGEMGLSDPWLLAKYWRDFISYHSINIPLLTSVAVLLSAEYKDQSWRLWIAKGISQLSYYFTKLLCALTLVIMISFIAILTGAVFGVLALGMPMSGLFVLTMLKFFAGQCIAHMTVAVLGFTLVFLLRNGDIASCINMLLLVFGTMVLSKLEKAWELGEVLTGAWAFGQFEYATFGLGIDLMRLLVVFVSYLAVCSLIAFLIATHRDVS